MNSRFSGKRGGCFLYIHLHFNLLTPMRIGQFLFTILFGVSALSVRAQLKDKHWNEKYVAKDYNQIITEEKNYLKYVLQQKMTQDYYRYDTYRLKGKYTGKSRDVSGDNMRTMKNVCATFPGNLPSPAVLNTLVRREYLFKINGVDVWCPIQKQLESPFQQEVSGGEGVYLYCVFFNSHQEGKEILNVFLISEFSK